MLIDHLKKNKTIINDNWNDIKKQLIWAFIVNLGIAAGIMVQMYFNQKMILYRLDQLETNQEAINFEILNMYRNDR